MFRQTEDRENGLGEEGGYIDIRNVCLGDSNVQRTKTNDNKNPLGHSEVSSRQVCPLTARADRVIGRVHLSGEQRRNETDSLKLSRVIINQEVKITTCLKYLASANVLMRSILSTENQAIKKF